MRTLIAVTKGLISKRNCLKFKILHSPFLSEKVLKLNDYPEYLESTLDETIRCASKWLILYKKWEIYIWLISCVLLTHNPFLGP